MLRAFTTESHGQELLVSIAAVVSADSFGFHGEFSRCG
jgi:hypothetical protein